MEGGSDAGIVALFLIRLSRCRVVNVKTVYFVEDGVMRLVSMRLIF